MKLKVDEMDAKWAIYSRNLGQNSRWKMILPLKNNFGRWIKILAKYDYWNLILTVGSNLDSIWGVGQMVVAGRYGGMDLGRRINTGVIWDVRSHWREEQNFFQKIGYLSLKNCQNIDNFLRSGPNFPLNR